MKSANFFRDKPLFGLDISPDTVRVMQVETTGKQRAISGYGSASFDPKAITDGVITHPEVVARAIHDLFDTNLRGTISTKRVALGLPAARTYSRAIKLPKLEPKEIEDAVRLEAEQYIPVSLESLYLDYTNIQTTESEMELFAVAAPRAIVDSYIELMELVNLQPVLIETTIDAAARLFMNTHFGNMPSVLIDFGPSSADITIVDKTIIATGTVGGGGDNFTARISDKLGVTKEEAHVIKTRYGLNVSRKQFEIAKAIEPLVDQLLKEVRRMIRYYEERYDSSHKISQIVLMGSGANLPGLSDIMTDSLRLPVRTSDPWQHLGYSPHLTTIAPADRAGYITAAGLANASPSEVFA